MRIGSINAPFLEGDHPVDFRTGTELDHGDTDYITGQYGTEVNPCYVTQFTAAEQLIVCNNYTKISLTQRI